MTAEQIAKKYVHGLHDTLTDRQEIKDMITDIETYAKRYHQAKLKLSGIADVSKLFAVGKIVEVKDCIYGHQFNNGELLRIIRHDNSSAARWLCSNTRSEYWLSEREANVCQLTDTHFLTQPK